MLKVKAIARGYFGRLMEEGESFEIESLQQYSSRWMEPVGWKLEDERAKAAKAANGKPQ